MMVPVSGCLASTLDMTTEYDRPRIRLINSKFAPFPAPGGPLSHIISFGVTMVYTKETGERVGHCGEASPLQHHVERTDPSRFSRCSQQESNKACDLLSRTCTPTTLVYGTRDGRVGCFASHLRLHWHAHRQKLARMYALH